QQLGSCFPAPVANEVRDHVMAFETACLRETPGQHGIIPELATFPFVPVLPLFSLTGGIRHMRRVQEIGRAALPAVADRATELFDRMGAVGVHEEIETGMGGELRDLPLIECYPVDLAWHVVGIESEAVAESYALV